MMFLVEIINGNLLLGFIPEQGAVLLCGISLISGAIAARKFFKYQDDEKKDSDGMINGEDK